MHHQFSIHGRLRPKLSGGAVAAVPNTTTSVEMAIDRQLEGLRELAFQAEPIRRLLDTGAPRQILNMAA